MMSDSQDYLTYKPGHFKVENTRNKHGVGLKTGATLRRNADSARQGHSYRNTSTIVKHLAVTEDWTPSEVEDYLNFFDGDLDEHEVHHESGERGKSVRSVVAQNSNSVEYSVNKKNRWLLSDEIKDEIERLRVYEDKYGVSDVSLTVIERELLQQRRRHRRPDVVAVASTTLPEKENDPHIKNRKPKRKYYSYSTDLLKLSQKTNGNDKRNEKEVVKPGITYELCNPRAEGKLSVYKSRKHSPEKQRKSKRPKPGKRHQHLDDDVLHYFSRKNNYASLEYE